MKEQDFIDVGQLHTYWKEKTPEVLEDYERSSQPSEQLRDTGGEQVDKRPLQTGRETQETG